VVHRDVKPANVLLREGHPLVADFGVALAVQQAGGGRLTETGLSVGTPYYMSPEQATGDRVPDARSDLYSVGCMLHEMLVGEPPFTGSTAQAVLGKVLTETPRPVSSYRPAVPPNVEATVLKALERLAADRFSSGEELSRALADPGFRHAPHALASAERGEVALWRRTLPWGLLALALVVGSWGWLDTPEPVGHRVAGRARIELPGIGDSRSALTSLVLSGDGRILAYSGYQNAQQGILVRRLGSLQVQTVPGTEGAEVAFLSDDGSLLGFRRLSQLFTIRLDGGTHSPVVGAEGVTSAGHPASLGEGGIVFAASTGGLILLPGDGAPPDTLTRPEPPEYHLAPELLPGGRHVLYAAVGPDLSDSRIDVISLQNREIRTVLSGGVTTPRYAEGYLTFVSVEGGLMAVPFDASAARATGSVVALGDQVSTTRFGSTLFTAAEGILLYGDAPPLRLVEVDRSGRRREILTERREWHHPRYSPDGTRIVLDFTDPSDGTRDVWMHDQAAGTLSRITQLGDAHDPMWLPDGMQVSFLSLSHPEGPLLITAADGSGSVHPLLWEGGVDRRSMTEPGTWLPDGTGYVGGATGGGDQTDLWLIPATGGEPLRLTSSPATEVSPALSRDGRWLAYQGNETGRNEIYIRSWDGSGGRLQISNAGGSEPVWGPSGDAVYYLEPGDEGVRLVQARIGLQPRPTVRERITVVANLSAQQSDNHTNYDLHPAGDRFIIAERGPQDAVVAIFNWTELIR
jgi:serine/threonine-protein kinase